MEGRTTYRTALCRHRREICSITLAVLIGALTAFGIAALNERADHYRKAQVATEQIRAATFARTALDLFARQYPSARESLSGYDSRGVSPVAKSLSDLRRWGDAAVADRLLADIAAYDEALEAATHNDGAAPTTSTVFLRITKLLGVLDVAKADFAARAKGAERQAKVGTVLLLAISGFIVGLLGFGMRVHRRNATELADAASTDALTGLRNRRTFDRRLAHVLAEPGPASLVVLDLDHFKSVNDQHGHAIGDQVLIAVAARLLDLARPADCVARLGGEEFAWVLSGCDEVAAHDVAQRACEAVRREPLVGIPLTISAGVATKRAGDDPMSIYRRADAALYRAKSAGRDQAHRESGEPVLI